MSPESLTIVASANARLSSFLHHASSHDSGHIDPGDILSMIESELPAIASILEEAGRAIGSTGLSENLDEETRVQVNLYARNLQELKNLLTPILASAQARRQRLAENTQEIHETQSWLSTLNLTESD